MRRIGIFRLLAYITAITMLAALALLVRAPAQELEQESSHPVLLSIAVTPADASILPDRDIRFTATGTYADGSTHDLTWSVTWSSSVPAAATINRVGGARALAVGQTTIEAALGAINGSATLNVVLRGGFVWTGSLNTALCCQTATMLNNGMVLMAGGWNYSSGDVASAELYDPATGTFTPTGSLNTGRFGHTATLLDNGMVLLAGGLNGYVSSTGILDSAELYNPATGTFSYTGSLNFPRWGHTATLLNNGMVLITGTWYSEGTAELYNPATGTFSYTTGNMNIAPVDQTATRLNNGMVLIAGGDGPLTASAELYNPATETFTPTGSLNTARARSMATLLNNGTVLIAGGYNDGGGAIASAELYDPATGTFTPTGSLNTARVLDTATLLNNGMVVIAGGNSSCAGACAGALASAELYDPATGTFTPDGSLNSARFTHTATLLNNGMVLIAGGEDSSFYYLSSAELYEPFLCPPPDLKSIAITPATSTLSPGETQRFIATGKFSDGTTQQLASVTWSSSNPAVAEISNDASNPGVGLAIAPGTVMIEARAVWVRGSARLTVQKK
jgi:hypothetical protein